MNVTLNIWGLFPLSISMQIFSLLFLFKVSSWSNKRTTEVHLASQKKCTQPFFLAFPWLPFSTTHAKLLLRFIDDDAFCAYTRFDWAVLTPFCASIRHWQLSVLVLCFLPHSVQRAKHCLGRFLEGKKWPWERERGCREKTKTRKQQQNETPSSFFYISFALRMRAPRRKSTFPYLWSPGCHTVFQEWFSSLGMPIKVPFHG